MNALVILVGIAAMIYIISMLTLLCCSLYQLYGGISKKCDKIEGIFEKSSIFGLVISVLALVVLAIISLVILLIHQ